MSEVIDIIEEHYNGGSTSGFGSNDVNQIVCDLVLMDPENDTGIATVNTAIGLVSEKPPENMKLDTLIEYGSEEVRSTALTMLLQSMNAPLVAKHFGNDALLWTYHNCVGGLSQSIFGSEIEKGKYFAPRVFYCANDLINRRFLGKKLDDEAIFNKKLVTLAKTCELYDAFCDFDFALCAENYISSDSEIPMSRLPNYNLKAVVNGGNFSAWPPNGFYRFSETSERKHAQYAAGTPIHLGLFAADSLLAIAEVQVDVEDPYDSKKPELVMSQLKEVHSYSPNVQDIREANSQKQLNALNWETAFLELVDSVGSRLGYDSLTIKADNKTGFVPSEAQLEGGLQPRTAGDISLDIKYQK